MSLLARMNHAIWRWLVPERHSIYDRQLLALALSLMSVGLVIVASASITEGGSRCRTMPSSSSNAT